MGILALGAELQLSVEQQDISAEFLSPVPENKIYLDKW